MATDKPVYDRDQIIHALTTFDGTFDSVAWARNQISYSIGTGRLYSGDDHYSPEYDGYVSMTDIAEARAAQAFQLWDDLLAVELIEVADNPSANIVFNYSWDTAEDLSYTRYVYNDEDNEPRSTDTMVDADVWMHSRDPNLDEDSDLVWGGAGLYEYLHQIGHALGLTHPGPYNITANYDDDATHYQDTRQYTLMSNFNAEDNGSGADHIGGSTRAYGGTPLLHDIMTAQAIYGANMTTRTRDTVYGFNSTAGRDAFDFTVNTRPVVAIWDAGGIDTLDLSGFTDDQAIDLREGAFSSVGPLTSNLAIAHGAEIENAIGGPENDSIIGNSLDNLIQGGDGEDSIYGGGGYDQIYGNDGDDVLYADAAAAASGLAGGSPATAEYGDALAPEPGDFLFG